MEVIPEELIGWFVAAPARGGDRVSPFFGACVVDYESLELVVCLCNNDWCLSA